MMIKFDKKNINKSNDRRWNWKINKLNLIKLKDWQSLYNFARTTHFLK